jgi:hypothetical protein
MIYRAAVMLADISGERNRPESAITPNSEGGEEGEKRHKGDSISKESG